MRKLPLIVFFTMLLMTISSCVFSYHKAKQGLYSDLNQALSLTIKEKGMERMRRDSIKAYRLLVAPSAEQATLTSAGHKVLTINDPVFQQYIKSEALRSKAFIAYHITPCADDFDVKMEAQASCSMAFAWSISDQRLSLLLCLGTILSLLLSVKWQKRKTAALPVMSLHLTPMQEQLMDMFMKAPEHRLTKQEICDALWPHKDNAAETLYTTIRRLRNELHESSEWEIESERGKTYELKRK
ncbi:MAG: helix-turn-helix domain-containing protein [Alloprevotella sp.]